MQITKAAQMLGHKGSVYTLEYGSAPHLFYSGGSDGLIVEWDLQNPDNGRLIASVPGVIYSIKKLGTRYLLVGTDKGGIHIIDLTTNAEIKYLLNHTNGVFDILVLPTQNKFIALGGDGAFSVWSSESFICLTTIKLCDAKLRSAEVIASPPGPLSQREGEQSALIVIACGDNTIRIIETNTYTETARLENHSSSVYTVTMHPNGKYLLSGSRDAHLNVYDVANAYALLHSIPAHNFAIYSIVFSPDGKLFATASRDKTLKIWDAETFTVLQRISLDTHQGHKNSVNKLLWTAYNNLLVSTGDDRAIFAWANS